MKLSQSFSKVIFQGLLPSIRVFAKVESYRHLSDFDAIVKIDTIEVQAQRPRFDLRAYLSDFV